MEWQKCLEPEALLLLGYMLASYHLAINGHILLAVAYTLFGITHFENLKKN